MTNCCPSQSVNMSSPGFLFPSLRCSCGAAVSAGIAAPGCHGDRVVIDIEVKAAFFLPLITNKQELSPYSGLQICLRQVE